MRLKNGDNFTIKEMCAMYLCMHLKTETMNGVETINENDKKNKRIFEMASRMVGGREKLDAITERFMKAVDETLLGGRD